MMEICEVKGDNCHPLFKSLKQEAGNVEIPWNFSKFVIDVHEQKVFFFGPKEDNAQITKKIEEIL
jgi:glutathione peroxidase-family protein